MTGGDAPERKFFTTREAAGYLNQAGLRCSYLSVYTWVRKGKLHAVKINKRMYITKAELDRFLEELSGRRSEDERLNLHGAAA